MIVIPMAGTSRRFAEAGYGKPKYMLPLAGRPLFDWTLLSFAAYFQSEEFLFIARDVDETQRFLDERIAGLGVRSARVVMLAAPTAGQAETVEAGLEAAGVGNDMPLAIFNIDTIRPHMNISPIPGADGWLEVFRVAGDNWSFVEPDAEDQRWVRRCTEKVRISDLCCTGLYAFSSAGLFCRALSAERLRPSSHELFVAPLYNHLIAEGFRIGWREAPAGDVLLSGVPKEYEDLKTTDLPSRFAAWGATT